MKITKVEKIEYYFIQTDEKCNNCYRRPVEGDADCWEEIMYDDWHYCTNGDEIEKLLQQELNKQRENEIDKFLG